MTCSTTSARPTNADFGFSGNWYDPATSGQGITVEVNPGSKALFLAWYTYAPNGGGAGPAGQRWYTAEQTTALMPGARTISVQFFETTGGAFDTPTSPAPSTVVVGSGTIAFESCTSATLSYNFTGGSSSGASGTHRPEAPRAGTGGLCDVNGRIASKFRALGAMCEARAHVSLG